MNPANIPSDPTDTDIPDLMDTEQSGYSIWLPFVYGLDSEPI